MDIYQYINSKDIRAHLESIGYRFSALEAAWLVYQYRGITMDERHVAWREIIETMPDMRVEYSDDSRESFESLHQFLRDYMEMEQRWFKSFITPEKNAVYEYEYYEREIDYRHSSGLFAEYDACFSAMKKALATYKTGEIAQIFINKRKVGDAEYDPFLIFDPYGGVKEVIGFDPKIEKERRMYGFFFELWFAFPTPFKKGDIVYDPKKNEEDYCQGPFVLTETAADVYFRTGKQMHSERDMTAYGYFQGKDGSLYEECMHHYMDLERYPEEKLTGKKRILKALSNHMKDEIDAVLFARAYHQILLEESARESLPHDITDKGMWLAGLTVDMPESKVRKQRRYYEAYWEAAEF